MSGAGRPATGPASVGGRRAPERMVEELAWESGVAEKDRRDRSPDALHRLELHRVTLPLTTPLALSRASTTVLDELVLAATLGDGTRGFGEVRGNGAYATGRDAPSVIAALTTIAPGLIGAAAADAAAVVLARTGNRLASALVDAAVLDALARSAGIPLWRFLGAGETPSLPTHASVALLPPEAAHERTRTAVGQGFRRFKIRVGGQCLADDAARLAAVRAAAPTAMLALDANGAWDAATAIAATAALAPFGIAWLEQPTAAGDDAAMLAVRSRVAVPVVADESVRDAADVARLAAMGAVDGVHLKLEKCGSVAALRQAARVARDRGLLVEIGQMDQGRLGSAHLAAAAAAIGADVYELWGFERAGTDVAAGLEAADGRLALSDRPGNGVVVALPDHTRVAGWS